MRAGAMLLLLPLYGLAGCGVGPSGSCTETQVFTVSPPTAVVSSSAAPSGNQVQFGAVITYVSEICAGSAIAIHAYPTWTNPDPIHITASSAADATNGTAVCKGPTAGPVTLTASTSSGSTPSKILTATVQLTCD